MTTMTTKGKVLEHLKRIPYLSLISIAAYAAYEMLEKRPYALCASAYGVIFGLCCVAGGEQMQCSIVWEVVDSGLDFIPLSLMNMELFLARGQPYAMAHSLFLIPLTLDIIAKLFGDEGDDEVIKLLKYVNNFANMASLGTISYMADNYMYAIMAVSFFIAQCAKVWREKPGHEYLKEVLYVLAFDAFYYSSICAILDAGELKAITE